MPDDQQPDHTSGGVPHSFRNILYWRWSRELPRPLKQGFVKLLYALGTAANTRGELRFARDGKPMRISDIASGAVMDEKDCLRHIDAAIAAGVVAVVGTRRRGTQTVYQVMVLPHPDWTAAVASLEASQPTKKRARKPAPWQEEPAEEFGGPPPELESPSSGGGPRNFPEQSSGGGPPNEFRGRSPERFRGRSPEQPRVTQVLPQDSADVGDHLTLGVAPEDLGEPPEYDEIDTTPTEADPFDVDPPPPGPPQLTLTTQQRRDARAAEVKTKSASSQGQMPLLLSVRDPEHVATIAEVRAAAEDDPEAVRRAIRSLGRTEAIRVYGHRLTFQHLRDDTTDTDTA
ncbi:hypothetical protein ACGFZK_32605 [Streptomyces sp. NPDC048257]|uniref:hypothetical protein n=1 Tax=Streptomyces sp. NPDC048257 TaxID=3365526 RepID=UPI0037195798